MRAGLIIVGTLLALTGFVWTLQGAGFIGGSIMTGEPRWLFGGLVSLVVGLGLIGVANRSLRR